MPSFWLGLLLIFLFSLQLELVPGDRRGGIERLILPALTLGLGASAIIARLVRSSMLEVLRPGVHDDGAGEGAARDDWSSCATG